MVYPGDVEVVVQVNGSTICSDVTDTSCTVDLPRDVYTISITQSNDFGSSVVSGIFDSECNMKSPLLMPAFSLQQGYSLRRRKY